MIINDILQDVYDEVIDDSEAGEWATADASEDAGLLPKLRVKVGWIYKLHPNLSVDA